MTNREYLLEKSEYFRKLIEESDDPLMVEAHECELSYVHFLLREVSEHELNEEFINN